MGMALLGLRLRHRIPLSMNIPPSLVLSACFFVLSLKATAEPITNVVPLTANLTFFLEQKGGRAPAYQFKDSEMIYRALLVNGTNIVNYRALPLFSQFYDFKLLDANGAEVAKTKAGLANSRPAKFPVNRFDLLGNFKLQCIKGLDVRGLFRPRDMFVITNNGQYDLVVKMRICVPMTNGVVDTNAMKEIRSFVQAESVEDFMIYESPPLLVKVMKD